MRNGTMENPPSILPADLVASIEGQTGAAVTRIRPRGGGGASRHGAEITLAYPDGREQACYLAYDSRAGDPARTPFFQRETGILAALAGPLAASGVRAPRFIAAEPAHLALVTELTPGSDRFAEASDPGALARDFMAQLAILHGIDPLAAPPAAFGDPSHAPSARIRRRIAQLRTDNLAAMPDPILQLALAWLEDHVPPDRGPSVIVHGDAGPGNFLHRDNRVTALLDWELTHFGDPMEDLAQIWVRGLFQKFVPMRQAFDAYEAAGGVDVDVDRIRYHRLYFQLGFIVAGHAGLYTDTGVRTAMLGVSLMFHTAHMRVIVQSLAELTGQVLVDSPLPEIPASYVDRSFEIALDDLREVIVPRLTDQHASTKAKSLARVVKWWRARERWGAAFERAELEEISTALGLAPGGLIPARIALAHAILEGRIDRAVALQLCFNRMVRETALMADGMGSLKDTYFAPLDGAELKRAAPTTKALERSPP
jgi:aminoglycoside phosphotransferase (APT) family kinase protein